MSVFRRRKLPVAKRPPLADDERVLAWAGATGEAVVVVTNLGLWLPGISGPTRLGWHEIHKATWSGRSLKVVPGRETAEHETYTEMADSEPLTVTRSGGDFALSTPLLVKVASSSTCVPGESGGSCAEQGKPVGPGDVAQLTPVISDRVPST